MTKRLRLAAVLSLQLGACARGAKNDTPHPVRIPVDLTVDNKSASDITVFVVHDGRTERLDRIEAVRKKTLQIPTRMIGVLGDLRLVGERQGARAGFEDRVASQSVTLQPCQRLEWTIEARVEQSTLGVFPAENCEKRG